MLPVCSGKSRERRFFLSEITDYETKGRYVFVVCPFGYQCRFQGFYTCLIFYKAPYLALKTWRWLKPTHLSSLVSLYIHLFWFLIFFLKGNFILCTLLPLGKDPFCLQNSCISPRQTGNIFPIFCVPVLVSVQIATCVPFLADSGDNHSGPLLQGLVSCNNSLATFSVP